MEAAVKILGALRDVKGVEGSFYATRDGEVVARDMPRIYEGDSFEDVATRLARMLEALAELEGQNEGALLRHPHHAFFLRATEHGMLGVLATADVNVPALKRGASLVARRLPLPEVPTVAARTTIPPDPPQASIATPMRPPPIPSAAVPPPIPSAAPRESSPSVKIPIAGAAPTPPRVSVPGAPTQRGSVPGSQASPAIRWRGTVKDS